MLDKNYFKNKVKKLINNEDIFQKLEKYVALIEEKNQVMNLTGFSGDQLWGEGILESLVLMQNSFDQKIAHSSEQLNFLDIGAGAGFPSLPYLISLNGKHHFSIYEPSKKRVDFLNLIKEQLELKNLTILKVRAEEAQEKEFFDCITARAVSELKNLVRISHHLGKMGCLYSFVKGPKFSQEINDAKLSLQELQKIDFQSFKVVINHISRENYLVQFIKKHKTPKEYPLNWAKIVK